jgi:endonuclease/exonuclease/phosphatase family metal-dependent hydrolase
LWRFAEDTEEEIAHIARALTSARLRVRGEVLDIATTHFTWSVEGLVTPTQTKDLDSLLTLLCDMPEFILTGDFNAPRGRKTFDTLAQRYKDNIPSQYKTSIDIALHRAGKTRGHELVDKMVDGLFTTPAYRVHDVVLHTGVSDHMGITARITKL